MKSLILILVCLLMVVPCQAAETQSGQAKQIPQRLKIQEERLRNMEEIILKERQDIENWYSRRLAELRQLAERRAKQIILSQRMQMVTSRIRPEPLYETQKHSNYATL